MSESTMTINDNGTKIWKNKYEQLHRLDGPALECANGTKQWLQNGQLHRVDGPALEWNYGTKSWYQNGKRHRVDGPAVEHHDGNSSWYYKGKHLDYNLKGFWGLWELLNDEERQNVNLHMWLARLTSE